MLDAISSLNQQSLDVVGDPEIATRIGQYEMAFRMQTAVPELADLSKESPQTLAMYGAEPGKTSFANNCLLARRLIELLDDTIARGWGELDFLALVPRLQAESGIAGDLAT